MDSPPAAVDIAIDELCKTRHKRFLALHVFLYLDVGLVSVERSCLKRVIFVLLFLRGPISGEKKNMHQ